MTTSLTDRYVDAAMRTVPERQRADLGAELRASIADQIDARVEAGEGQDAAERAVLTELGDPEKLAAGYMDRPLWLVGPRYYLDWKRLLTLLLWIVPACAAFGVALGQVLSGAAVGQVIGSVVGVVISVVVHLFFWVTLVFVVLERTGHATMDPTPWTPDRLPEPRATGAKLSDVIGAVIWPLIIAGALLWDHFLGLATFGDGWIPFFHDGLWPWGIAFVFVVLSLEIVVALVVYARRRWTFGLAAINAVLSLAIAVPALILLARGLLVNPAVTAGLVEIVGSESGPGVFGVGGVLSIVVGFVVAGTTVWGIVDAFLKARRGR